MLVQSTTEVLNWFYGLLKYLNELHLNPKGYNTQHLCLPWILKALSMPSWATLKARLTIRQTRQKPREKMDPTKV